MTPPPFRDVPSPDLGSDKENAPPANDSPITLTKFFNRIYTRPKAPQQPLSLPKGRLIDVGNSDASYDHENDESISDSDDEGRNEHVFVVQQSEPLPTGREERGIAHGSPQRRPLADIALGDSRSRSSPVPVKGALSSSPFESPSPFRLARPTPAPSSSPLASVINAINGTPSSPSSPLTPSAPRIAVTPAEPSSPSPTRRQLRPGAMLHPSPDAETDSRRTSVDLQESLSVHFDESSFDLLKDKISLPEHDSLGDLDMDMGSLAIKTPQGGVSGENVVMPSADAESDSEPDFGGLLEERLRDMKIVDDEVPQSKDSDGMESISTPPALFNSNNYNPSSQFFFSHARLQHFLRTFPFEAPQAPVRQSVRPGNKIRVPAASITSNAPPALLPKRGARASISGLPLPAATTALRGTKKAKPEAAPVAVMAPFLGRKTAGGATSSSHATTRSAPPPPRAMELGGVQRPPASSVRAQAQSHRNTQTATQVQSKGTATAAGTASRSSGLRPPTSRASNSGIAVLRRVAASGGGAMRTSIAVGGTGRLGSSGVAKTGLVKGDGASSAARVMRRA